MAKRPLFKKKSGVTTPVLSKKKAESDADAVARLKVAGWNPDKVPHHVVDGKNVSELHAGEQAECITCSKRKGKTESKKSQPEKVEKKAKKKEVKKPDKKKSAKKAN